jgi:hypothetical protein
MYVWKIIEGLVPNVNQNEQPKVHDHIRHGRMCYVPFVRRGTYQNIRNASLSINGPKLFNAIPKSIRNMKGCTKLSFKLHLDKFLKCVPDEPQIPGYVIIRRADSNSIIDMVRFAEKK